MIDRGITELVDDIENRNATHAHATQGLGLTTRPYYPEEAVFYSDLLE